MIRKPRGDLSKLPKWAQDYVGLLERTVDGLQKDLGAVNTNIAGKVSWSNDGMQTFHGIPDDSTVRFVVGNERIDVHINSDGRMLLMGEWGEMRIVPRAANSIIIYSEHF